MFNVVVETSGIKANALLKGQLNLSNIADIKDALLDVLDKHENILIRIDPQAETDFSCLQFLCSFHKLAIKKEKSVDLTYPADSAFARLVAAAGYSRRIGCSLDSRKTCLWLGGANG